MKVRFRDSKRQGILMKVIFRDSKRQGILTLIDHKKKSELQKRVVSTHSWPL